MKCHCGTPTREKRRVFIENGVKETYIKTVTVALYTRTDRKNHTKYFIVIPEPMQAFHFRFCLTALEIFLLSCKTKFGIEHQSVRLFHNLPITHFFLLKSAGTLG